MIPNCPNTPRIIDRPLEIEVTKNTVGVNGIDPVRQGIDPKSIGFLGNGIDRVSGQWNRS